MAEKKGFTLIELLVVIAIIALLMAILMPALSRVKTQAKAAACLTQLKQWGLFAGMYGNDNNYSFPPNHYRLVGATDYTNGEWLKVYKPYIGGSDKDWDIATCPAATKVKNTDMKVNPYLTNLKSVYGDPTTAWGIIPPNWWHTDYSYGSYGYNGWCSNLPQGTEGYTQLTDNPAYLFRTLNETGLNEVPVFFDCTWIETYPTDGGSDADRPPAYNGDNGSDGLMKRLCFLRHDEYVNITFGDCSARKAGLKELWTLKWHKKFDTANIRTVAGGMPYDEWPQWMRSFRDY